MLGIDIDRNPRRARRAIGIVPQELNLDAFFTPRETLELQAGLYGVPKAQRRTDAILEAVGLSDKADAYARSLSGGMRRRLLVAKALVHSPPVIVLDEPTAGVDVELRRSLWAYMRAAECRGRHRRADHALPRGGRGAVRPARHHRPRPRRRRGQDPRAAGAARREGAADHADAACGRAARGACSALGAVLDPDGRILLRYRPSRAQVGELLDRSRDAGIGISDLATSEADLEELFLRLTGDHAQAEQQSAEA